jgi:hypothetical protein
MKTANILAGLIALICVQTVGQEIPDLKNYALKPVYSVSNAEDSLYEKDKVLGLYYGRIFDYRIENNRVELWECFHLSNKVYDNKIMEHFNIFYLPTAEDEDIIDCKARYIDRSGTVKEFSKEDLEEIEEDETKYKVFRFPAAETGSILEYYYIVRRQNIRETGSYTLPARHQKELDFMVIFPDYLNFEITAYNGLPTAETIENAEAKIKCVCVHGENVAKVNNDPAAFYVAHLPRIEFLLTHNYSSSRLRLNSLNSFANNFHQNITKAEKKELSALKKINAQIGVGKGLSQQEKVMQIENHVKTHYYYYNSGASVLSNIADIHSIKLFNLMGSLRLFYHLFKLNKIDAEIVLTTDKTDKWFDKNFNGTNYFDEALFYFPVFDKYMSPIYAGLRVGYPDATTTGQDGAFFKEVNVGNTSSFLHEMKHIPAIDKSFTGDTIDITLSINPDEHEITAGIRRVLTGYAASSLQYRLSSIDFEKEDEDEDEEDDDEEYLTHVEDHYLGLSNESTIVSNRKLMNINNEDVLSKPLILTADLKDYYLARTSNDSLKITIGAFIGKQSEMIQDIPRTLPVERRNNIHYYRIIKVDIPQGYTCLNTEELNREIYDEDNKSNAQAKFTVSVRQEGNKLIILCEEYFNRLIYPAEEYEKYQRVAQASADFNKQILLFKKQ